MCNTVGVTSRAANWHKSTNQGFHSNSLHELYNEMEWRERFNRMKQKYLAEGQDKEMHDRLKDEVELLSTLARHYEAKGRENPFQNWTDILKVSFAVTLHIVPVPECNDQITSSQSFFWKLVRFKTNCSKTIKKIYLFEKKFTFFEKTS